MPLDTVRWVVSRHPAVVAGCWLALAAVVGLAAPNLSRLAAEGQAHLLPAHAESTRAAALIRQMWPDQWFESMAVLALSRPEGLKSADHAYARDLARRFLAHNHPTDILRVLGPESPREVASRLLSQDGTTELLLVPMSSSFVSPASEQIVQWLRDQSKALAPPPGLGAEWTGDAVIGRDYMAAVQASLDRAALATVFLLLAVLLAVYRSLWLSLVPLVTIGVSLVIARGVLAWLFLVGWEISPLVELFLVVILFGCGTDFCLFLSWRYGEHWNPSNPGGAMRATLKRAVVALVTSAGTVIAGLCLMGTTRFKLFSSTGPSVALGLALTLAAALTLTPALLILLARFRPRSFRGLTTPSSGFWDEVGHKVLARPVLTWLAAILVMVPAGVLGLRSGFTQDLFSEMPKNTPSVQEIGRIAAKFGQGTMSPLTVVLEADRDLRESEGLAVIDNVSRFLTHQKRLAEVRSATQPLGSPKTLERARLASRLGLVDAGFEAMVEGATLLQHGLNAGAAKLRTAMMLEKMTGISLTGGPTPQVNRHRETLSSGLAQVTSGLLGGRSPRPAADPPKAKSEEAAKVKGTDPREFLIGELGRAADGAGQIADGARRAHHEVSSILADPVGKHALDRLLITKETVRENPDLLRSFAAYISHDGRVAKIDLVPDTRIFSAVSLDQVVVLRRRLHEYLQEERDIRVRASIAGVNAGAADIRAMTDADQFQSWIIVPVGVFLILVFALRDVWACLNLVVTMLLTYAFALGVTHAVFVWGFGAEGLDWKVPLFLFVLLVAVGVDYNVFLMARLQEESQALGLRAGITRAVAQTGGLITSAAAITACSFASFLFSPLVSIKQLGFALVVGILVDASLVRPVLVPCGQWLLYRRREGRRERVVTAPSLAPALSRIAD
jgi:RND superfamily putative drug exporter